MHRWVVLLALASCEAPAITSEPARSWLVPPGEPTWPQGPVTGTLGRSQPPQPALREGIAAAPGVAPLHLPTPWTVPGDPARAVVYGLAGTTPAVEMIDIDRGALVWRDLNACAAPVVGVTAEAVVCADAHGVRAVGLDGKPRWRSDQTFIAMTDERVILAGAGESVVLDAGDGAELARVKLPPAVTSDSVIASCGDAGRELFAVGQDGKLVHIVEGQGGPKLAWSTLVGTVAGIEACTGTTVLVTASTDAGTALIALARDTGKPTGRVDGVRGYWPARDGTERLEVSTPAGVVLWPRDLSAAQLPVALPVLGELLARRGDARLVRATPLTAALLDRAGVRAYVPLAEMGAVLGDRAAIAGSWLGSPGNLVRRFAIPPARYGRVLRVPLHRDPLGVPAELRDLPPIAPIDVTHAVARDGAAQHVVPAIALDPDGRGVYALALDHDPDDHTAAALARFELATRAWTWLRGDGCAPGTPVAVAASRSLVACAARGAKGASVRATRPTGEPLWEWTGDGLDAIEAAGDVVIVRDGDRATVLDAVDGRPLAHLTSDDGAAVRAAALDVDGMTLLVVYERGRVSARLPRVDMMTAWSVAVAGAVRAIVRSADGVVVALDDGDAYRIAARSGEITAVPGLDLRWSAGADLVTGEAAGGPIPPAGYGPPPAPRLPVRPVPRRPKTPTELEAAPIATPWPPPPAMADSWQLTLYELTGGLRARNDYALAPPIALAPGTLRGPAGSPLVVGYGPGLRELLVIDPRRGDPVRRMALPEDAAPNLAFSSVVDGKPIVGTVLANPLRVVVF